MNEGLKKLFEQLAADECLGETFKQCKTPEEAYKTALEVADGYTMEEFQEIMKKFVDYNNANDGELTENDLDQVSGGITTSEGLWIGGASAALAASIISASSAAI